VTNDTPDDVALPRAWLAHERATWQRALRTALDDAIEHLQFVIFDAGWQEIRANSKSDEEALRASVRLYEARLTDLLRFARVAGIAETPVAWSQFKTDLRRAAREANLDITLRTVLDEALYSAETTPHGDPARYRAWSGALMLWLAREAQLDAVPRPDTTDEAMRIEWAYRTLAHLEDHAEFDAHFARFLDADRASVEATTGQAIGEIVALHERLAALPRFDLVLNAALRWLADATSCAA
jgi:hypothetical protein